MKTMTSRTALAAAIAIGVVAGIAAPAFADVDVLVNVTKTKTINVNETITKFKRITLIVDVVRTGEGAAEAQALANILTTNNTIDLDGVDYSDTMTGSVVDNIGLTQLNQAAGNMQNQGNVFAVALVDTGNAFANAQAEVDQVNTPGAGTLDADNSSFSADMDGSVTGNTGVTQVNQDSGNSNNQTNAVAVAAGIASPTADVLAALSEAALGQTGSNQNIDFTNNTSSATMTGSVTGNTGITGVNQSSGAYANQANVVAVGAAIAQF